MNDQPLDMIAQLDQATAGAKSLAKLFGDYFRFLLAEGLTRDEALAIVIEYQHILLVGRSHL